MNNKMKIGLLLLAVMALVLVPEASAYQSYATATGASCGTCHVNPSGGGTLTPAGTYYKQNGQLPPTPVLTTISVSPPTVSLSIGGTQTFTAAPKDQNGNAIAATITWTSSNTSVGTIDTSGKFTASAAGSTTIKAASGTVSGTAAVTVTAPVTAPGSVLTTIKVSPARMRLAAGSTQLFTAITIDQFSNPFVSILTWTSSNTDVGTIDADGKFTAITVGTTIITANSGTVTGPANVKVIAPKGKPRVTSESENSYYDDDETEELEEIEDSNED